MAYPNYAGTHQLPPTTPYPSAPEIDQSRIRAISERVRSCQATASTAYGNLDVELNRILGSVPTTAMGNSADPFVSNGALDELDNLVSMLTETLDRVCSQTQRLSSI